MVEQLVDFAEEEGLDPCVRAEITEASSIAEHRLASQHLEVALAQAPFLVVDWSSYPPAVEDVDLAGLEEALAVIDELKCWLPEVTTPAR